MTHSNSTSYSNNDEKKCNIDKYLILVFLILFLALGMYQNRRLIKNRRINRNRNAYTITYPKLNLINIKKEISINLKDKNQDNFCSICQSKIINYFDKVTTLKCNHIFHKKCIEIWSKQYKNKYCPVCRENIV